METNDQDMLADLPLDLWAQDWELVPDDTYILEKRSGRCHIAVYVRSYGRGSEIRFASSRKTSD